MKKGAATASVTFLLIFISLLAETSFAQGADVRRRTIAITYLRDPVKVQLAGTTLRANAKGEATVERWRKRNESEIDITIENMIPAFNYGGDFTTYVLWAITPAGQVDNLGEFRLSGGTARLKAATPHQTFALLVTAEPHYLVKLPSRMVVLENLAPVSKNVQVHSAQIFFVGDSGKYYTDTTTPQVVERDFYKIPPELLQARRAVQIARLADSERHAPNDYASASNALQHAEAAYRRGANVHEIGRISRESITFAVRARDIAEERAIAAERRSEIARRDADVRRATEEAGELGEKLSDTETRLKASEIALNNANDQLERSLREAADLRSENRTLKSDNDRLKSEMERLSQELASARTQISDLESRYTNANAKITETNNRLEEIEKAERDRQQLETRRQNFNALQSELGRIVTVKPNGDGFVAVLGDAFFLPNQTVLSSRMKAKMDALAQALSSYNDQSFVIEGHSDTRSNADSFALGRAQSVADYITALGVRSDNFTVESRGTSKPASSKRTVAARALNRRVEIVFVSPK
jgi:outer membrane protein OmpA-like peptidoglycan-associated protein